MDSKESLVQSLVKDGHLKNPRLIEAFQAIDRADFVLPEHKSEAYANYPLPIGEGQTISQPQTVAFMLELLDPQPGEKILDIGAGSGWQTALLAYVVCTLLSKVQKGRVVAVERIPALCEMARRNLEKCGLISNGGADPQHLRTGVGVELHCQDATRAIPGGSYDKIIAAAAANKEIPGTWKDALKVGGRIVAPVDGSVWMFVKKSEREWEEKEYTGFSFVPLMEDKSKKIRDKRLGSGSIFILYPLSFILLVAALFAYEVYLPHSFFDGAKEITIAQGIGSRRIGALLKQEGIIRSKWAFVIYVLLKRHAFLLKPGVYNLTSSSIAELGPILVAGAANESVITIPEGWSVKDIAAYLAAQGIGSAEQFKGLSSPAGSQAFAVRFSFLQDKPSSTGLEGYLFPDTYRIFKDAAPRDVILKMLDNFDRQLNLELRQEVLGQEKTIFAAVTMASLLEKEVVSDEDRALVAGILWKRLEAGIPLQVDATLTYIKNQSPTRSGTKTKNNGKISLEDTMIDSPYNTYKYRGLPQGPIANPGLSAIRAAIYPKKSPYLYYLSAQDGRTIFSRTLEEHNEARARYLSGY